MRSDWRQYASDDDADDQEWNQFALALYRIVEIFSMEVPLQAHPHLPPSTSSSALDTIESLPGNDQNLIALQCAEYIEVYQSQRVLSGNKSMDMSKFQLFTVTRDDRRLGWEEKT